MNTTPVSITQQDLKRKYREGIDYLDANYAFFLTQVLNIGAPNWTLQVPTAAVGFKPGESPDDFQLMFNAEFAMALSASDMGFIQSHETMHIVLEHLKILGKFENRKAFNVASDCVINDYLVNMGLEAPEGLCRGEDIVGYDCANSTVRQVYDDLKQKSEEMAASGEAGEGDEDGPYVPGQEGQFDDHSFMEEAAESKDAKDTAQKLADQAKLPKDLADKRDEDSGVKKDSGGLMAGSGIGGLEKFAEAKGVSMKWVDLLREVNPDVFRQKPGPPPRPSYHLPRRKLSGLRQTNPDLNLPVMRPRGEDKGETPAIAMALDTSGSIGPEDANRFISLARSIPKSKIKLFVCTFTTQYMPLDLDNPEYRSGGTAFDPISQFIENEVEPELGHYPKAVVVITDGQASFHSKTPPDQFKSRWLWLMFGGAYSTTRAISNIGQNRNLADFSEGMI